MRAGNLWHRVKFYAKVSVRGDYGDSQDTWPAVTVSTRGEIRYTGGDRTLSAEEKFYSRTMELTVRHRDEIVETMRVTIDGGSDYYAITYIEEIGRKEGLRIILEKINT